MSQDKIKSQKEIIEISRRLKKQGKKVVTRNGSFDILHLGHVKSLREAKKQGDVLIVLLNSDKSVKVYKGSSHPIVSQKERAEMLASLESVDYVVLFDEIKPGALLTKIKPNVHCVGPDWGKYTSSRKIVEESGGRIHILKKVGNFSTSGLIKRILRFRLKPEIKAVFLDRDGTINIDNPKYHQQIEDFKFAPHAIKALQKLAKTDYKIIVATNQAGIGRGFFKESDLKKLHSWLLSSLKKKKARIDRIYYCPHRIEENCACRKPKIGLLLKAVQDYGINLSKSWFVGDSETDVLTGKEGNLKTIMLKSRNFKKPRHQPDFYAKNLLEAAQIILKQNK